MYSKVIVPLDGSELSERSLPYARLIAGALSLPIELVEAFDVLPPAMHAASAMFATERMLEEARAQSGHYLEQVRTELRGMGFAATATTLPGAPAPAIVDWVGDDPEALVVMSTHGRGGIARWALGSVADKVLHSIPNPVLLIRGNAGKAAAAIEPKAVLVPLDGSTLSELSLEHAATMAAALRSRIVLLRINLDAELYRQYLSPAARGADAEAESDWASIEELTRAEADDARMSLERAAQRLANECRFPGNVALRSVESRNVAEAIVDVAAAEQAMPVMTTHGRSGINRLVLGSVTDRVVRHSDVPVLVVRQAHTPAHTGVELPIHAADTLNSDGIAAQPT